MHPLQYQHSQLHSFFHHNTLFDIPTVHPNFFFGLNKKIIHSTMFHLKESIISILAVASCVLASPLEGSNRFNNHYQEFYQFSWHLDQYKYHKGRSSDNHSRRSYNDF